MKKTVILFKGKTMIKLFRKNIREYIHNKETSAHTHTHTKKEKKKTKNCPKAFTFLYIAQRGVLQQTQK